MKGKIHRGEIQGCTKHYRTEQKVYFHKNTLFTNICDRVIIDS